MGKIFQGAVSSRASLGAGRGTALGFLPGRGGYSTEPVDLYAIKTLKAILRVCRLKLCVQGGNNLLL